MNITLSLNPTDPSDLRAARSVLDALESIESPESGDVVPLDQIVRALLDKDTYGFGRLGYAGLVALNAPDPTPAADVLQHFIDNGTAGKDPNKAIGGTHRSLEKTWRAIGGSAYSPMFISNDKSGAHCMTPEVGDAVRDYLRDDLLELKQQLEN